MSQSPIVAEDRELVITRTFDVPRELVWKAWTERDQLMKWSCPTEFTMVFCEGALRVDGQWRTGMRAPDGEDYVMRGSYRDIAFPERLVFTHCWEEDDGSLSPETLITLTFIEQDGKTTMQFKQSGFASLESRDSHNGGWGQAFDKLQSALSEAKPKTTVKVTRYFEASPAHVFDAWLDPSTVGQWLFATPTGTMTCVEIHPHVGGRYTITERRDGVDAVHTGEYLEIERPSRLVFTLEDNIGFQHTTVIVELTVKNNGCELTLTHQGVLSEYNEKVQDGWTKVLNGLASILH